MGLFGKPEILKEITVYFGKPLFFSRVFFFAFNGRGMSNFN